jgi:sugar O-acyltransferase (sialic acid O-acetyltransferase NeuD family)
MKKKQLVIIGLSNNAKIAAFYFNRDTEYNVIGFAVDKEFKNIEEFYNLPVFEIEKLKELYSPSDTEAFVAVGYNDMNEIRKSLYQRIKNIGYVLPNYISPKCSYLSDETIGDNNFILEDNTIQPFVKIGSNNVFWSGNHIGHDVEIGDHNFITSHVVISGFTKIKNSCFIGVNATLRDDIIVADKTLIAAGSIIMTNTNEEDVYLPPKSVLFKKKSSDIKISK